MDFFARQDQARKTTKWLIGYFAIAVVLIVLSIYAATLFVFHGAATYKNQKRRTPQPVLTLWNPKLFLITAAGTLTVIFGGTLVRTLQLSSGGSAVAESLGGRVVPTDTNDPQERKLLNVIEEMAIASGVPMPKVYVMDGEQGINAFAAGHNLNDAAIGVTRGCIANLTRDELQGVIGHEFSHILNGDMRLNLRLMGVIFGIMCIAVIGRQLLNARSSGRDRNPLPWFGLVLLLLGWVGVFFGRLIQAAISRQREFLADASAVQFTRNPQGLSGALQKIGGRYEGSAIENEHAAEASHLFFGNALKSSFFNPFATHPPLEERIRAIDTTWDGNFPVVRETEPEMVETPEPAPRRSAMPPIIPGFPTGAAGIAGAAAAIQADTALSAIGNPTPLHLRYAVEFRESLPDSVRIAAREPQGAAAILLALLLAEETSLRDAQLQEIASRAGSEMNDRIVTLAPEVSRVAQQARLPLVNITLPALRQMQPAEFAAFSETFHWLIASDDQIVLFEFVLEKIVTKQLTTHFARARPVATQYYSIKPLLGDCEVLLSALAHTGHMNDAELSQAFRAGAPFLRAADGVINLQPREACGLSEISQSLDRLSVAVPQIKKNVLEACARVVGADGIVNENEAELLRGVAETLDCPIPPFVTT